MSLYSSGGKRIFVAEDDPAILELLTARLEIAGHRVTGARDGATALRMILANPPLDGCSVLRALRGHGACVRMPVLMLTARKSAADVKMARDYGADDYLAKPFEDRQLLARVERLLRSRGARTVSSSPETAVEDGSTLI